MRQTKADLSAQIFAATDRLMAKEGLHHLSMHKLAKEAGIAAGTIYLYFKNKDELLTNFARQVFCQFIMAIEQDVDENQPLFNQYRTMWWNIWRFLQNNPTILCNINQYRSLPEFVDICREPKHSCWDRFCEQGRESGILADLSNDILFMLSLKTAMAVASDFKFFQSEITDEILESVVDRSWRAIQK